MKKDKKLKILEKAEITSRAQYDMLQDRAGGQRPKDVTRSPSSGGGGENDIGPPQEIARNLLHSFHSKGGDPADLPESVGNNEGGYWDKGVPQNYKANKQQKAGKKTVAGGGVAGGGAGGGRAKVAPMPTKGGVSAKAKEAKPSSTKFDWNFKPVASATKQTATPKQKTVKADVAQKPSGKISGVSAKTPSAKASFGWTTPKNEADSLWTAFRFMESGFEVPQDVKSRMPKTVNPEAIKLIKPNLDKYGISEQEFLSMIKEASKPAKASKPSKLKKSTYNRETFSW